MSPWPIMWLSVKQVAWLQIDAIAYCLSKPGTIHTRLLFYGWRRTLRERGSRMQEAWDVIDWCIERVGWGEGFRAISLLVGVCVCDYLWWFGELCSSCKLHFLFHRPHRGRGMVYHHHLPSLFLWLFYEITLLHLCAWRMSNSLSLTQYVLN